MKEEEREKRQERWVEKGDIKRDVKMTELKEGHMNSHLEEAS